MESFSFLEVYPLLQKRIICKLEGKSYLRLQQTCHYVNDFIERNQKIKVFVDEAASLNWIRVNTASPLQLFASFTDNEGRKIRIECLRGIVFESIKIPPSIRKEFPHICQLLKSYRISAVTLDCGPANLKNQQYTTLFTILTPIRVVLDSVNNKKFEALLSIKKLKQLHLFIDPDQALSAIKQLLPKLENARIVVEAQPQVRAPENVLDLFRSVLEFLRTESPPKLLSLTLYEKYEGERPSPALIKEIFPSSVTSTSCYAASQEINLRCIPGMYCRLDIEHNAVALRFSGLPKGHR